MTFINQKYHYFYIKNDFSYKKKVFKHFVFPFVVSVKAKPLHIIKLKQMFFIKQCPKLNALYHVYMFNNIKHQQFLFSHYDKRWNNAHINYYKLLINKSYNNYNNICIDKHYKNYFYSFALTKLWFKTLTRMKSSIKGILLVNFPEKEKDFLIKNLAAQNKIPLITQSASLLLKDSRNMNDLLGVDDPIQVLFDKVKTSVPCICVRADYNSKN